MQVDNEDIILYNVPKIREILHCGRNVAYNLMNSKDFRVFKLVINYMLKK